MRAARMYKQKESKCHFIDATDLKLAINIYFDFCSKREKNNLYKTIEKLSTELEDVKEKYEELRSVKQEAVRELLTLQEQHKAELRILTNSQMEEANARENLERKLCELRSEVRILHLLDRFRMIHSV